MKDDFLKACRKYPAWIWPNGQSKFHDSPWNQFTEKDAKKIHSAGFADCLQRNPTRLNAGWMKMRACCYVYPNTFHGGLRDMNMYVLPCQPVQDGLAPIDEA